MTRMYKSQIQSEEAKSKVNPRRPASSSLYDSSDDDASSSDDSYMSSSSADDSSESEEEEPLGLVERLANAVRTKQQQFLDARRNPALELKATVQWYTENAAGLAAAEQERIHAEAIAAERAAVRERKHKRRKQQRMTKQKEQEFRMQLQEYDDALDKNQKRLELLTKFALENRANAKQCQVNKELAIKRAQEEAEQQRISAAVELDRTNKLATLDNLQQSIATAAEIGRRSGLLPAINTALPNPQEPQDETSTVLILRVNPPDRPLSRSDSASTLPAVPLNASTPVLSTAYPKPSGYVTTTKSVVPTSPTAKRLFFTVNLKRFKHVEEIRGEAIGDRGGKELARSLLTGACPRVKQIYLGWNHIKYPGIAALADCFTRGACGQLQTLDLRCNNIDAKAFQELLATLAKGGLPELLDLVLQGNHIGDEGAKVMVHAMLQGTLKALRLIDIRQNKIRNAGMSAIWNVFTSECLQRFCPKLQLLDLRRNDAHSALTRSFCPCPSYLAF